MKKIFIFGNSGSGKSTLANNLQFKLGIPAIYLDEHHWGEGWEKPKTEDFRERVSALVEGGAWVIEGSYHKITDVIASEADVIILLSMPRYKCIWRAMRRQFKYVGKELPFMAKNCPVKNAGWKGTLHFAKWIFDFDKKCTSKFLKVLSDLKVENKLMILKSNKAIQEFVDRVS